MNKLYKIYFFLPNFSRFGIIGKVIDKVMAKILKIIFDKTVANFYTKTQQSQPKGIHSEARENQYIVSLTSFPARIDSIWICLESILRQTVKPDMIILWLAEEQFPDKNLPQSLLNLIDRGLTIKYCDDLKSHKKYYYVMQEFPKANVITLDDDVYYPEDILEKLINLHSKFPNEIASNRVHKMRFSNNKIRPYKKWLHNHKKLLVPSHLLVQTGIAGVLYPPDSLDKIVFDKNLIKSLCFNADDLWLKFTAYKKQTKIVTNNYFNKDLITIGKTHEFSLIKTNGLQGGNDIQFEKINNYFNINFLE